MLKVLLTGSQGFLGYRFLEYYKGKYDFLLLNRNTLDMTKEKEVLDLFKQEKIDIVFHTAAIADMGVCESNPDLAQKTNVDAAVNIAKGCALKGSTLVFASTDQVYNGNALDCPCSEETQLKPHGVYANGKLRAEEAIAQFTAEYYHLRLNWMFAFLERNKKTNRNILINVLHALNNNAPMTLSSNDYRSMTYAYEVIENFEKIIELPYGVYNAGSENTLSTYDIGVKILTYMGLSQRIDDILIKEDKGEAARTELRICNEKLKALGVYFSSTEDALKRCIEEYGYHFE